MNKQELIRHNRRKIAQLKKIGELSEHCKADLESAEIALASLEAEPVHQFIYNNPYEEGYTEWLDCNADYFNGVPADCRRILYTNPPAPVNLAALVPDEISPESAQAASSFTVYEMSRSELLVATEMWNACRAEMLRRIENSTKS